MFTVKQQLGETLHEYFWRFAQTKAQIRGIFESSVIDAIIQGLASGPLFDRLHRCPVRSVSALMCKFEEYARAKQERLRRGVIYVTTTPCVESKKPTSQVGSSYTPPPPSTKRSFEDVEGSGSC